MTTAPAPTADVATPTAPAPRTAPDGAAPAPEAAPALDASLRAAADALPFPALLVDAEGTVRHLNSAARADVSAADGVLDTDPLGEQVELLGVDGLDSHVVATAVRLPLQAVRTSGSRSVRFEAAPLRRPGAGYLGALVTFADVTAQVRAQARLEEATADTAAVHQVLTGLAGASTAEEATRLALDTVRSAFGWVYGSYWRVAGDGLLHYAVGSGDAGERFRQVTVTTTFEQGVGLSGRAWRTRDLYFCKDIGQMDDCPRAPVAQVVGVRSAVCFPVLVDGAVVGTMDFFSLETLHPSDERLSALRQVGRLVGQTLERLLAAERREEAAADSAALNEVLATLSSASTPDEAAQRALDTVRSAFGWVYGSYWRVEGDGLLHYAVGSGETDEEFRTVTATTTFAEGVGLSGRAWRSRDLYFCEDIGQMADCPRAPVAQRSGIRSAVCFPVVVEGRVVGTMDFFATETLRPGAGRLAALRNVGRLVGQTLERLHQAVERHDEAEDTAAVNSVLSALAEARTPDEAVQVALDAVRSAFGWAYGSYWRVRAVDNLLHYALGSGDVSEEFRRVTMSTTFAEGVGLSGRAWRSRDLYFTPDIGLMEDCPRAPVAQKVGVRSGVCLPVLVDGAVVGTMDFFSLETLQPSSRRLAALRNVGQLVGQTLERLLDAATQAETAADTRAINSVLSALTETRDAEEAAQVALDTVRSAFDWAYGSYWRIDPSDGELHYAVGSGDTTEEFRRVTMATTFREGVGLSGRAWRTRDLYFTPDIGKMEDCPRAPVAQKNGIRSAVCFPILMDGKVAGTMDFFSTETLEPSPGRLAALRNVGQLVGQTMQRLTDSVKQAQDVAAVNRVLGALAEAQTADEAAQVALDTVRSAFDWAYGSYWRIDDADGELHYAVGSGETTDEFRRVTMATTFREGVGLSGRAWRSRDLYFTPDIGQMEDCPRAPVAQKNGIRSAVCFPVLIDGKVVGTMDFFSTETLEPSPGRLAALRNVGQLVGQNMERLLDASNLRATLKEIGQTATQLTAASEELSALSEQMGVNAGQTLDRAQGASSASSEVSANIQTVATAAEEMTASIREISRSTSDAARVAASAVSAAESATSTVGSLGESSAEIGKVIKVITSIAQQTNLLALNATIEAARAGEAGKGFAVVANEVKELAKETAKATEDIGQKVEAIQGDTRGAVDAIGEISSVIGQISDIQTTIAGAVEEQTATTNEIARNVNEASGGSNDIAAGITIVAEAAQSTTHGVADIQQAAGRLATMAAQMQQLLAKYQS